MELEKQDIERLNKVKFFVEATSFEQFSLWIYNKYVMEDKKEWLEESHGFGYRIGLIDEDTDKPVFVSFSFATIADKYICFYNATSRYVDHSMVENWLKTNFPIKHDNDSRWSYTDAQNFHIAF